MAAADAIYYLRAFVEADGRYSPPGIERTASGAGS